MSTGASVGDVPHDERDRDPVVHRGLVGDAGELAELGGQPRLRRPPHELLLLHAVLDQVLDGDDLEPVGAGELEELRQPRHAALVVQHLADHAHRGRAGQPREVHRRLGMAGAAEHPAGQRAEREDVAGPVEVFRARGGVDEGADGDGAIVGGDAGGDAAAGVHGGGEGGAVRLGVVAHHQADLEVVEALAQHGHADEAAAVAGHEVHRLRGDLVGGHQEVALVLAILVVHHHQHPARPDLLDGFLDGGECTDGCRPRGRSSRLGPSDRVPPSPARERESRTCRSCPFPG